MTKKQARREKRMREIKKQDNIIASNEKPTEEQLYSQTKKAKKPVFTKKELPSEEWRKTFLLEVREAIRVRDEGQ